MNNLVPAVPIFSKISRFLHCMPQLAACALLSSAFAATKLPPAAAIQVDFNRDVKPILAGNCYGCHGPRQQQSGLRLDKRQNALRGGDYGPVIVPGNSAESKLILRLVNGDGGLQMPPTGALSDEEIGILRAWIDQGGEFADVDLNEESSKPKSVDPKVKALIAAVRAQDTKGALRMLANDPGLVNRQDAGGSTPLHHAAGFGNIETLKALLDRGADVNAKNRFNSTPLHWAITDYDKVAALVERGAAVNAKTVDGRTPLYLAASARNSDPIVTLLLERGADPNGATLNGRTPLMAAASGGSVPAMRSLIAHGADIKRASGSGSVALIDAAGSRNAAAVQMLLDHGADANARTKRGQTALAIAAMGGAETSVKLLLVHGAQVNVQDDRGYSPLMYAAYSEKMPAGIARILLSNGADRSFEGEGETAATLAAKRGDNEVARMLDVPEQFRKGGGVVSPAMLNTSGRTIFQAVQLAASVLATQSPNFIKRGGCNSCHNQSLPSAALGFARDRGMRVPAAIMEVPEQAAERSPERTMDMAVIGVNSVAYEAFGFAGRGRPADEYTDAIVHYFKSMQTPEGRWETAGSRPPLTSDEFQTTAMVVYALRTYGRAVDKADTAERLTRAARWLQSADAATTQEHTFQVLGLYWAGASAAANERAAAALAATQRTDGGWAQLPSMGTDAYATGQALYALGLSGMMRPSDAVFAKGVAYLMGTQAADGSWHVKTRSLPFQPYFDSGFPYAQDQWISAAGTSYAIMALTLASGTTAITQR